jgi:trehalose 6-phosphate synthase
VALHNPEAVKKNADNHAELESSCIWVDPPAFGPNPRFAGYAEIKAVPRRRAAAGGSFDTAKVPAYAHSLVALLPMTKPYLRVLPPLVVALALLTWWASVIVSGLTRSWFEKDAALRASLAVRGARSTILRDWRDPAAVTRVLEDITHDERIMGTAACGPGGDLFVRTSEYPSELDCGRVLQLVGAERAEAVPLMGAQHLLRLPAGDALLSAVPLVTDAGTRSGFITLLHDFSYVERRENATRRVYVIGFLVLAVLASVATMFFQRAMWRRVRAEFRRLALGGSARPEFAPLLRDVRELADRLANHAQKQPGLGWTRERLKETLATTFAGERLLIVSNREPYIHEKRGDRIEVQHPASGLVTALEPVMRACSGVWIAHGSGSADRETSDKHGRVWVPPGEKLYTTRRVLLTPEEEGGYYYGFSNEGLWPLCHVAHTRPRFRANDYDAYGRVNAKFAEAVDDEADRDDPIVLVQDYHLALAPRLIHERLPLATILTFWHIPWPAAERLGICPQHAELLAGLLGSSIVGFHTQQHCNNFLEGVDRHLEARIDRELDAVLYKRPVDARARLSDLDRVAQSVAGVGPVEDGDRRAPERPESKRARLPRPRRCRSRRTSASTRGTSASLMPCSLSLRKPASCRLE